MKVTLLFAVVALLATALSLPGCALSQSADMAGGVKPTVVLVHGAFQNGPGSWSRVVPLLEKDGYKVIVVNLPGRDEDRTEAKAMTTDVYRDAVISAMSGETRPVVLVGHSFGGITITNVAEAVPEKIKALVFLAAYLPKDGQSMLDLAKMDKDSHLGTPGNLVLAPDFSTASIKEEAKADIFANDASTSDRQLIVRSLISEPAKPQGIPVKVTSANRGRVPTYYVMTSRDHAVSPYLQQKMLDATPVTKVIKIDSGHAPYITKPAEVKAAIETAARS